MSRDLTKTLTYLALHLIVGFSVAYLLTGSLVVAGGIALIEPAVNAVAFFFHEKAWKAVDERKATPGGSIALDVHRLSPA
jgi:uncharacterized membrane protein